MNRARERLGDRVEGWNEQWTGGEWWVAAIKKRRKHGT
jgi:hypothetical protein